MSDGKRTWVADLHPDMLWSAFLMLVVVALAAIPGTMIVKAMASDGRADFCYVEHSSNGTRARQVWYVEAHRPWRPDQVIGYAESVADARAIASAFGCRFATEKP